MNAPTDPPPIPDGDLSITTADGTQLHARSDVELAAAWAAHENGPLWPHLTPRVRARHTTDALNALRAAYTPYGGPQ